VNIITANINWKLTNRHFHIPWKTMPSNLFQSEAIELADWDRNGTVCHSFSHHFVDVVTHEETFWRREDYPGVSGCTWTVHNEGLD
jgi:hypothetical protein